MAEFYIMISRKYFSGFFFGRGGEGSNPIAPPPVSYAYGWAPGLPPAKSGPALREGRKYPTLAEPTVIWLKLTDSTDECDDTQLT